MHSLLQDKSRWAAFAAVVLVMSWLAYGALADVPSGGDNIPALDTPIPVEPNDGIGDTPIPVEPNGGIGDTPIPVEPNGGIGDTPIPVVPEG